MRDRDRERETDRQRDRETGRERDIGSERERERERERVSEKDSERSEGEIEIEKQYEKERKRTQIDRQKQCRIANHSGKICTQRQDIYRFDINKRHSNDRKLSPVLTVFVRCTFRVHFHLCPTSLQFHECRLWGKKGTIDYLNIKQGVLWRTYSLVFGLFLIFCSYAISSIIQQLIVPNFFPQL